MREKMYFQDKTWLENYRTVLESYLNIFVFADQYSVHQLRDDILTAMMGQAHNWEWFPDPDEDLLASAYDRLPNSAKFMRLLVISTAHCWLADVNADCVARLQLLRQWNSDFASEVSLIQAQIVQKCCSGAEYSDCFDEGMSSSCVVHEHLVLDKD